MLNRVQLIGHVGKDPEIRTTQGGQQIANFRIATTESWRDKNTGERREKTEWHSIVVFNEGLTKVIEKYVQKGSKLFVEGSLQTRKWQNREGKDQYSTEVVLKAFNGTIKLLDRREGGERRDDDAPDDSPGDSPGEGGPKKNAAGKVNGSYRDAPLDDEIPF